MIRRCKRTFVIDSGYGIPEYLATLCPEVTELGTFYEPGKDRLPTYRRMAAEVVSAAVADAPVCLATYGHPWVYCYPTTLITRAAPLLDLHVEVFPGISAFDTLLVDLGHRHRPQRGPDVRGDRSPAASAADPERRDVHHLAADGRR